MPRELVVNCEHGSVSFLDGRNDGRLRTSWNGCLIHEIIGKGARTMHRDESVRGCVVCHEKEKRTMAVANRRKGGFPAFCTLPGLLAGNSGIVDNITFGDDYHRRQTCLIFRISFQWARRMLIGPSRWRTAPAPAWTRPS